MYKRQGYKGCYSRVTDFICDWRAGEGLSASKHAFVPLKLALAPTAGLDAVLIAVELALGGAPPSGRVAAIEIPQEQRRKPVE